MAEVVESTELTLEDRNKLEELGLAQVSILEENGRMRQWEPQSLEDALYYLEREIAEIEDLLKNSFNKKRKAIAKSTSVSVDMVTAAQVNRAFNTVPSGGPSDTDLYRKQFELEQKLEALKSFSEA